MSSCFVGRVVKVVSIARVMEKYCFDLIATEKKVCLQLVY